LESNTEEDEEDGEDGVEKETTSPRDWMFDLI
jgi:hypothetical protein